MIAAFARGIVRSEGKEKTSLSVLAAKGKGRVGWKNDERKNKIGRPLDKFNLSETSNRF